MAGLKAHPTLNEIAYYVAGRFNKTTDSVFINEVKFAVKFWRAQLIRQDHAKNGNNAQIKQRFVTTLIKVDKADSPNVSVDCDVLRSEYVVPEPVRLHTDSPYIYVGQADFAHPFGFIQPESLMVLKHLRFGKHLTRYTVVNGFIFIFGNKLFRRVGVESIFVEPVLAMEQAIDATNCFTDDEPFYISSDMLTTLVSGLIDKTFTLSVHDDKETTLINGQG